MSGKALKEAIKKIRGQLNLPVEEAWTKGPKAIYVSKQPLPKVADLTELPPIEEIKRFELPKFEFNDDELKKSPTVTFPESIYPPGSKMVPNSPSMIKGVNEELYSLAYTNGIINFKSHFNCKWFQVVYFHPLHYISKISKSSPAILVSFANNNIFNQEKSINLNDVSSKFYNSAFPFKYATGRHQVKKIITEAIFNIYQSNSNLFTKYGGTYKFSNKLYPKSKEDIDDFNESINKALNTVFKIPNGKLMADVKSADSKLHWRSVEKVFKKFQMEPIKPHFNIEKSEKKKTQISKK